MNVLLTSAYKKHLQLDLLKQLAAYDRHGDHRVVQSPNNADVIIFVEDAQFDDYFYSRLLRHPLVKRFPEKVFMYNEVDYPWCALPGLYCSMPSGNFQHGRQLAFPYLSNLNPHVPYIHQWDTSRRWLFSFVGSASHKIRRDILALNHPRAGIHDTSQFDAWKCQDKRHSSECSLYANTMAESEFVLCPRGLGTSSSRLFEALEAGRAPVIISDNWVEPPQIDWSFAIRVPESNIASIPTILESRQDEAHERGQLARQAWEQSYSTSTLFHTTISSLQVLIDSCDKSAVPGAPLDKIYRTKVQLEHSTRSVARALRNWQAG